VIIILLLILNDSSIIQSADCTKKSSSMAPSVKALEAKLRKVVEEVFHSEEKDLLSVRLVRDKVTDALGLEQGFFTSEEWKEKSKTLIKELAVSQSLLARFIGSGLRVRRTN
jgi:hypothetical protein